MDLNTSIFDQFSSMGQPTAASPIWAPNKPKKTVRPADLYNAICSALLPHRCSSIVPLNLDRNGILYLDHKQWTIDGFVDHEAIMLDMDLDTASKCRNVIRSIAIFLDATIVDDSNNLLLSAQELLAPVQGLLRSFLDSFTESVEEKRHSGIKDLADLNRFLTAQQRRLDPLASIESLLTGELISFEQVSTFWSSFLQSLNFQLSQVKESLFDSFVRLLCKYLSRLAFLQWDCQETSRIAFFEQLWADELLFQEDLAFARQCAKLMPRNVKDEVQPLDAVFLALYEEERNRVPSFTQHFLVKLSNRSLAQFVATLSGIVLNQIAHHSCMESHFQRIKQFYLLNQHAISQLSVGHGCLPPFELTSNQTIFSLDTTIPDSQFVDWPKIEKEFRSRLTRDGGDNVFCEMQHWSLRILLDGQLYQQLDSTFLRLYKLTHSWHRLMSFWERRREAATRGCTWDTIKTRHRQNLLFQIAQQLQNFTQVLFSQFATINSHFMDKLAKEFESPNICLKRAKVTAGQWTHKLESLNKLISTSLSEPLDETEAIVEEMSANKWKRTSADCEDGEVDEEDEDPEVKKYLELMLRLRRVRLFLKNGQPPSAEPEWKMSTMAMANREKKNHLTTAKDVWQLIALLTPAAE